MELSGHNMLVDVYAIRRDNLERVLTKLGSTVTDFSKRTGVSPIYLTQVLSAKTQRRMGATVARRIESHLDLPEGWFDMVDMPGHKLTPLALDLASKFDQLPETVQERLAHEIDTLFRYSVK